MHFNFDNKLFTGLSKLVDVVVLSVIWMVCCIPIFTIGAASTAMYYTVHKSIIRNRGYFTQCFFQFFKNNFKQTTLIWLIQLLVLGILGADIAIMTTFSSLSFMYTVFFYLFIIMTAMVVIWITYTIAYQARFENTIKNTLKNAAIIGIMNFQWSLLILLIDLVVAGCIYFIPVLVFVLPAIVYIVYDLIIEKIFRKYMSPEELKEEEAEDQIDMR